MSQAGGCIAGITKATLSFFVVLWFVKEVAL